MRWDQFRQQTRFRDGEDITVVGRKGSGKTVLLRELVGGRFWCAVLGTKNEDKELYGPFEEKFGFEIVTDFDPSPPRDRSRIIFRPRLRSPDRTGLKRQADQFRAMLTEVWAYGGWTIVADELLYLTDQLGLGDILSTLWETGRSMHVTIAGATQQPVRLPRLALDQATHLFFFRTVDADRVRRISEIAGADGRVLRDLIPVLPRHEFLYVNTDDGIMLRSKVTVAR